MKKLLFVFLILFSINFNEEIFAQSPYFRINVSVKNDNNTKLDNNFGFYFSICKPLNTGSKKNIFYNDTSGIDWKNLPAGFFDSIKCTRGSGSDTEFEFGDQMIVFNEIINAGITRRNGNTIDTMLIVFPVIIKSFVTIVDLTNIPFKKGIFEIMDGLDYTINPPESMYLYIKPKSDYEWKSVKESKLVNKY